MINSLRYRLLFWFVSFIAIAVLAVVPFSIIHNHQEKNANEFIQQINTLHINLLKDLRLSENFISHETTNPEFYITGESKYLDKHEQYIFQIENGIDFINQASIIKASDMTGFLQGLAVDFDNYNRIFDSIIYLTYKKGYNEFGLAGELKNYASQIENFNGIDKNLFHKIRQDEKEYLARNDSVSIKNFTDNSYLFSQNIAAKKTGKTDETQKLQLLLEKYRQSFDELVTIDRLIGNGGNAGLKSTLNQKSEFIETRLQKLIDSAKIYQQKYIQKTKISYGLIILSLFLLTITVGFFISKHVVSHLESLTRYISNFTKSQFNYHGNINLKKSTREIAQIYKEFRNMAAQLIVWEKQRDKALKTAEENEQRYRELAEMLPQSIFETDHWGNFTYVNRAWYKNFGYSTDDLGNGLNLIETVISATGSTIPELGRFENSNFIAIRKDGSRFPASLYSDNILKDGKVWGRRGIIIDITERNQYIEALKRERTKALASNQHKSFFLANMSHEIRTPMNSIIGFSNLLTSNEVPDDQKKEFINYIQSSGELLLNLIDDIIDISKIEAGEIKIKKKECNLQEILNELRITFEDYKNKSAKGHLDLRLHTPDNSNLVIKTDPMRLRQVLVNLIGNAIKFTDEGFIEFGYNIDNERKLEFYVKDTGIGLSRSELDIIFERFKRTKITEQRDISGTGLGLAISKNLVKMLGGEMWVDSIEGKGTTFYFTIPLLRVGGTDEKTYWQEEVQEEYLWNNKTILVTEDDENSYRFVNEILKNTGARVLWAKNGNQAEEMVKKYPEIDLVLMDVLLPEQDGYETTRHIKNSFHDLPIIAQTAFAMEGDKEKSVLAGCDDYITKPLNVKNLLAKVNQFIYRRYPKPKEKPAVKNNDKTESVATEKNVWKDQMNEYPKS